MAPSHDTKKSYQPLKMMRLFTLLWVLLLNGIMTSCSTVVEEPLIVLPPMPERETIDPPENTKDMARLVIYYEFLVERWEAWGETVENITEGATNG